MPEKEESNSFSAQQFINLMKGQVDKELERLDQKFDEKIERIESKFDSTASSMKDHIETVEEKLNTKLDAVDEALRGNGRIGVFEQLRNMKLHLKVITLLVLGLLGFKVFSGLGLDDLIKNMFSKPSAQVDQKKPATQPTTQPTTRPSP